MKIKTCSSCDLCLTNNFVPVSGRGNMKANIMIVGEAPGYYERKLNTPFVGKSGRLIQYFINRYNFTNDVYITNMVKCRPPGNRKPSSVEVDTCNKYIKAELLIIKPKIVILLGNTAIEGYYGKSVSISKLSGNLTGNNPKVGFLYHPAYILRNPSAIKDYIKIFDSILEYYRKHINIAHVIKF